MPGRTTNTASYLGDSKRPWDWKMEGMVDELENEKNGDGGRGGKEQELVQARAEIFFFLFRNTVLYGELN